MLNAKDIEPIGRSDHEERIKKAAGLLRENGFAGLVTAGPTNLFYFCGAKGGYSDRLYGLVIKSDVFLRLPFLRGKKDARNLR